MLYYILDNRNGTFVTQPNVDKVGTYLLGRSINHVIIFKVVQDGVRSYVPMTPDVFQIQKELEAL